MSCTSGPIVLRSLIGFLVDCCKLQQMSPDWPSDHEGVWELIIRLGLIIGLAVDWNVCVLHVARADASKISHVLRIVHTLRYVEAQMPHA